MSHKCIEWSSGAENSTTCTSASSWSHFVAGRALLPTIIQVVFILQKWLCLCPQLGKKPTTNKACSTSQILSLFGSFKFHICGWEALLVVHSNIHVDRKSWHKKRLTHAPTTSHWQQCKVLHHLQGCWKFWKMTLQWNLAQCRQCAKP